MDILIFKTNLHNTAMVDRAKPLLQNISGIQRWNVDIHDCDKILRIEADSGGVRVYYNGVLKATYPKHGSGWYFKAGVYTQSNLAQGDAPDAYGEVVIYSLHVQHD